MPSLPLLNTHERMNAWLGNRQSKKLSANKMMYRGDNGDIHVRLVGTDVVTAHPDNTFTIRHGGWNTQTTHRTIGDFSPARTSSMFGNPTIRGMVIPDEGVKVDQHGVPVSSEGLVPATRQPGGPRGPGIRRDTGHLMGAQVEVPEHLPQPVRRPRTRRSPSTYSPLLYRPYTPPPIVPSEGEPFDPSELGEPSVDRPKLTGEGGFEPDIDPETGLPRQYARRLEERARRYERIGMPASAELMRVKASRTLLTKRQFDLLASAVSSEWGE